jgi:hypothetical protein
MAAGGGAMSLFHRKPKTPDLPTFSLDDYEPVLRCSICTGEQIACFRDRKSGDLHEIMPIRNDEELQAFCDGYGLQPACVRKIY